jgi:hypothetical protein
MNRREALRLLASGAALQFAPAKMLAILREARAVIADQTNAAPRTLNSHQDATVKAMAEMILPRTETPGAEDVGVSEFIDLMLTEWYAEAERTRFLAGLSNVDAQSQTLFSKDFVECSEIQRGAILNALGEEIMAQAARRDHTLGNETEVVESQNFYSMMRWLTLTAYYTSEAGATQALHYEVIPERHAGCVEVTLNAVTLNSGGSEHQ